MKKLFFVFLVVFIFSCSQAQSQKDFYGTWIYQDDVSKMEYVITENTITATFSMLAVNRSSGLEIISWKKVHNEDNPLKADWPIGFLIEFRLNGQAGSETFYISRSKIYLINSSEPTYVYVKQD